MFMLLFFSCHILSPLSVLAPPIGYHKVTKEDELSDSEEEEEVYIKEEAGGNGRGKEAEEGGTQLFRMEKVCARFCFYRTIILYE